MKYNEKRKVTEPCKMRVFVVTHNSIQIGFSWDKTTEGWFIVYCYVCLEKKKNISVCIIYYLVLTLLLITLWSRYFPKIIHFSLHQVSDRYSLLIKNRVYVTFCYVKYRQKYWNVTKISRCHITIT